MQYITAKKTGAYRNINLKFEICASKKTDNQIFTNVFKKQLLKIPSSDVTATIYHMQEISFLAIFSELEKSVLN